MEDESQEILLSSLENFGVSIPENVSSVKDLNPATLVSICGQCLNRIDGTASFCTSLPDSMAEKFRICTELSSAVEKLGYIGDMSYYKFLYPSEEDLYKLIRFLVERLSESPKGVNVGEVKDVNTGTKISADNFKSSLEDNEGINIDYQEVEQEFKELRLKNEVPESSNSEAEVASDDVTSSITGDLRKNELTSVVSGKDSSDKAGKSVGATGDEQIAVQWDDEPSLQEQLSEIRNEVEDLQNGKDEQEIAVAVSAKTSELQNLKEEFKSIKTTAEIAFDDSHPTEFYLEQVDAKKQNLVELESQWAATRKSLEEKKRRLEESLDANKPEVWENLQKLREVELERQSVLSEIQKRDNELAKLTADLKKQPKVASRRSNIERVKEITKNSRKQDADIERILRETREIQLESNSIQERLNRTYAVVDEMVFREAKKDSVGRQAYRLLTSIHESFEQVSEKILATDRVQREMAEYEKKLAVMASRSLNVDKLQADLDAIMKENEYLEQCLKNN
ncbi:hypothetical protein EZV62_009289 [Acer yangbiense]|uniref:Coiled-coil domain-containing protein 22 homolog n=1 Tax=Acer yangbiense TaxID=1000413 RepID=A0A5C7IG99_9ROSI|nr:hypothetical protein EZV62_009289 [Acer yangbiense]